MTINDYMIVGVACAGAAFFVLLFIGCGTSDR